MKVFHRIPRCCTGLYSTIIYLHRANDRSIFGIPRQRFFYNGFDNNEETMILSLPFTPVPCPRPKITMRNGYATAYYPSKYKNFKRDVTQYIRQNFTYSTYNTPIKITYTFVLPRPKYLQRKKDTSNRIEHAKKPDLDNLVKAINDVLEGSGVVSNDSIIYSMDAIKYIAAKQEEASILLTIEGLRHE